MNDWFGYMPPGVGPTLPGGDGGGDPLPQSGRAPRLGGVLQRVGKALTPERLQGLAAILQDLNGGQGHFDRFQAGQAEHRQQAAEQERQQRMAAAYRNAMRPDGSIDERAYATALSGMGEIPSLGETMAMNRANAPQEDKIIQVQHADGTTELILESEARRRLAGGQPQQQAPNQSLPPLPPGLTLVNPNQAAPSGAAAPQGIDWNRVIQRESGGDQSAVSPRGAFGRAQLMPGTADYVARRLGDPSLAQRARTDPAVNERLGQAYLQEQLQTFGNPAVALAAYNAGPGKAREWVRRFGSPQPGREREWAAQIPYRETREYVLNILEPR